MAGNHVEFGLFKFESPSHHFLRYSRYYSSDILSHDEFLASNIETEDCVFVALNPYRYPTPHARFDFWSRQTTPILDILEARLSSANEIAQKSHKPIIVLCHYPMNFWTMRNEVSSTGRTFEELIADNNVSAFLSGHTHPDHTQYAHHNGTIEVIAQDLTEHDGYFIVTIDNGRLYHHTYTLGVVPEAILTHPIPAKFLSKQIRFSEEILLLDILHGMHCLTFM